MPGSPEHPQGHLQLGDYRLVELIFESSVTRTYHAEQLSMDRVVLLERIKAGIELAPEVVENFLADVRAKAAVDHPGIGSVYEGVHDDEAVYYTRELLTGDDLEELHNGDQTFAPATIATFLRQVASAMDYYQTRQIATLALEPRHLVLGEHAVLRMANLAIAEASDQVVESPDCFLIADLFLDLLQRGAPGATRTSKLLTMMTGEHGTSLTWEQVEHTARKLEKELSEGAKVASLDRAMSKPWAGGRIKALVGMLTIGVMVAALGAGGFFLITRKARPKARDLSAMVEVPAGSYQTHGGKAGELKRFWIDAHEVSIAEYAEFMEALAGLPEGKRSAYDDPSQPAIKLDHDPDQWTLMYRAARTGKTLDGLALDLNHAVTGIDWWDAQAYANWKGGRLPTQEEWLAAAGDGILAPSDRGAVDELPGDVTAQGVYGLAGNVAEWIYAPARNPAFPMNAKGPLCCGASYLTPRNGVVARTWLATREIRRRDLGFRVIREAAP